MLTLRGMVGQIFGGHVPSYVASVARKYVEEELIVSVNFSSYSSFY